MLYLEVHMDTAHVYCRVSTDEQSASGYSLPGQLESCRKYCEQRGYAIASEWQEDYTGTVDVRPALDQMLGRLKAGDVVVCHALDRLARGAGPLFLVETKILARKCRAEFVMGDYGEDASGQTRKAADKFVSEIENIIRVERSTRGKLQKAKAGIYPGSGRRPYGFVVDKSAPGGLRIDPTEARVVQRIFATFLAGASIRGIANALDADGIPPHTGQRWAKSTVARMLGNATYAGQGSYNKMRRRGKALEARPGADVVAIAVPAIVEPADFSRVQLLLAHNRSRVRRQPSLPYPLRAHVFCAACGKPYHGENSRGHRIYRHRVSEGCSNANLDAATVEEAVRQLLAKFLADDAYLRRAWEAGQKKEAMRAGQHQKRADAIDGEIARLEAAKQRLYAALEDGLPAAEVRGRIAAKQAEIDAFLREGDAARSSGAAPGLDVFDAYRQMAIEAIPRGLASDDGLTSLLRALEAAIMLRPTAKGAHATVRLFGLREKSRTRWSGGQQPTLELE